MNSSERVHSKRSLVEGLNDAIRDNPLGAGLIGAGMVWMLFGSQRMGAMGRAVPRAIGSAAGSVGGAVAAGGHSVASGVSAAGSQLREASHRVKEGIADTFAPHEVEPTRLDAGDVEAGNSTGMTDTFKNAGEAMRGYAQDGMEYGNSLKDRLGEGLEKQPLLLGAIGLAIGAGIAAALPSTRLEADYMREQGAAAREKIQEAVTEFKTTAQQVVEDVKQEAQARGFTPDGAKEALRDIADKAKNVASSARDTSAKPN